MADVQCKDTAVGSHGVVPILYLHDTVPRVRFRERVHQPTKQSPGPSLPFPHSVITPHHTHPQLNAVEVVHQARVQLGTHLRQLIGKDKADVDTDVILPQFDQRHAL